MSVSEKVINESGSVCVKNNKIIVKDPIGNGNFAIISPPSKGKLYMDGKIINKPTQVEEKNNIIFEELKLEHKRNIEISYTKDKLEAYISIEYEKEKKYPLKDTKETNILYLEVMEEYGDNPPNITKEEILKELENKKIVYGIDENTIEEIIDSKDVKHVLIAKGKKYIPPIEDKIKIFFNSNEKVYEENKKIDHRSFNSITSVKANDILAEIIKGENGINGIDIFNNEITGKLKKNISFSAGNGTKKEKNLIIATIDGKPNFSKNKVWIEPIYVLNKDVTIETGNINFPANVEIKGKVTEGMKVISGGSLLIQGGVFSSDIEARNSTDIKGNIVNSNVKIGGVNLLKSDMINSLKDLKEILNSIVLNVNYLKRNNLIKSSISIGILIKSLIENKFKSTSKILIKIISNYQKYGNCDSVIINLIKTKLLGISPCNIKDISEIEEIIYIIDKELISLEEEVIVEANLNMEYAQESKIEVVGNINISGKGLFTSELYATKSIIFTKEKVVCRGGYLKAEELIKASIVGSDSGVFTNLEVSKNGNIYVDIAYRNTTFIIGNKKHILENNYKKIHVYIDKDGSLVVDKLLL